MDWDDAWVDEMLAGAEYAREGLLTDLDLARQELARHEDRAALVRRTVDDLERQLRIMDERLAQVRPPE